MWSDARPRFDTATEYSYEWAQELVDLLRLNGCLLKDFAEDEAVSSKVIDHLKQYPNIGFIFYDHGNEDCLWGNDEEHMIDLTNNSVLKNREVYTMACLSAKKLGADSTLRYKTTYWGYVEVFSFMTNEVAAFKEAANHGMKLRLQIGSDWQLILKYAKQKMTELVDQLIEKGDPFAAVLMRRNRDALVVYSPGSPPEPAPPSDCPLRAIAITVIGLLAWRFPPHNAIPRLKTFFGKK